MVESGKESHVSITFHHDKQVTKICLWVWSASSATIVYVAEMMDQQQNMADYIIHDSRISHVSIKYAMEVKNDHAKTKISEIICHFVNYLNMAWIRKTIGTSIMLHYNLKIGWLFGASFPDSEFVFCLTRVLAMGSIRRRMVWNKGLFGGTAPVMHPTRITKPLYLSLYPKTLRVGDT